MEVARLFGDAAHYACHLDNLRKLNEKTLDDKIKPYLDSWRWLKSKFSLTIIESEISLYSERYDFAGTIDNVASSFRTDIAIYDIKTSASLSPVTALQTAGYAILLAEEMGRRPEQIPRFGVRLKPGEPEIQPYTDKTDIYVFLGILSGFNWKKRKGLL